MPGDVGARARRAVGDAWTGVYSTIRKFNQQVTVRPRESGEVFRIVKACGEAAVLESGPVVLTVPQRAETRRRGEFYVVISGVLVLSNGNRERLETRRFATKVAYFRENGGGIDHVYGAHFDLGDGELAHPVFHSQMRTNADLLGVVRKHHPGLGERALKEDLMARVPRNFRLPTAQMDFFSVLLQVCSDHLVGEGSGDAEKSRYCELVKHCGFFQGYGGDHPGLRASRSRYCYRSHHWYAHG